MKLTEVLKTISDVAQTIKIAPPLICGGLPRDYALGRQKKVEDIDLTNGEKTIDDLAIASFKVLKSKIDVKIKTALDGHKTIYFGNTHLDFSSHFIIPNIDEILKKKNIESTPLMQELYSRDFTCNALLMKMDMKTVLDPTKMANKDLQEKVIKTILEPEITLVNSKDRIVRALYLASKLNFKIDNKIFEFVSKNPDILNKTSTPSNVRIKVSQALNYNAELTKENIKKMNLEKDLAEYL